MSVPHLITTGLCAAAILLTGCSEVRTQSERVDYLKKPLKPLPDVATYSVSITPAGAGSASDLKIEGKQQIAADGDVHVAMQVGQPEITRANPGSDVYVEYLKDANGNTVYRDGNPIVARSIPVYWIDVEVSTVSSFSMAKRDGAVLEQETIPQSTSFVYGKKPTNLLGGAVTLWTGGDWVTDPVWLAAQWQIQGNVLVAQRGKELQRSSLRQAGGIIEQNYSEGMRTAEVPVAFFKDDVEDVRLQEGYQAAVTKTPEGVARGIALWTEVIDDKRTDADGEPLTTPIQRACAHLNIASVRYIQADWNAASAQLNLASSQCAAYDEGFFEGIFKSNKKRLHGAINQLRRDVEDRRARDAANAKPTEPAKPGT